PEPTRLLSKSTFAERVAARAYVSNRHFRDMPRLRIQVSLRARAVTRPTLPKGRNLTPSLTRLSLHSITSSARRRCVGGLVQPQVFAVLRLIANSNFVGCSTGRSA